VHGPLWVGTPGAVTQIGRNGTIVRRLLLPHGQPVDGVAFAGDLWVADQRHRTVLRIAVAQSQMDSASTASRRPKTGNPAPQPR
jgi:hypothetical protein